MTLPVQPLRSDTNSKPKPKPDASLPLRGAGRRRPACLSAAWAEPPPAARRERRRAVCSWSVGYGYGTLSEADETVPFAAPDAAAPAAAAAPTTRHEPAFSKKGNRIVKACPSGASGKVADHAALLEPRGCRLVAPVAVPNAAPAAPRRQRRSRADPLLAMPGIKSLLGGGRAHRGHPDAGAPLVKPATSLASLRKCETVLALTGYLRSSSSSSSIEPIQAVNRLRVSPRGSQLRMCSRCSSLLTLASTSRYSLNSTTGGFVPVAQDEPPVLCKLCLIEVPSKSVLRIQQCDCAFCLECMKAYVEFEIAEGAYDISCPDAQCPAQGVLQQEEIRRLAGNDLLEKHKKYRFNREVELDKSRTWCPSAGCETVCNLCPSHKCSPQGVYCPTCTTDFCSNCKLEWHEGLGCDEYAKRLGEQGKSGDAGIPFDSDLIKCCPMCNVPIEKDEGCAQMMCKRCKHVFCWYCLASLDDDFLLRHYDKGPCKNKLGHSRASVIWHRTQVIGIFAGFGILLLVASPLLLLVAPCIVCCKCRFCNGGGTKLDNEEDAAPTNDDS